MRPGLGKINRERERDVPKGGRCGQRGTNEGEVETKRIECVYGRFIGEWDNRATVCGAMVRINRIAA